jgi:ATP-binding cassette subfamily B protein
MFRLLKFLKPYLLWILLSIGLLFAQAMADLALPNYMSEIVNVGIQQGGIESAVPEAIRQSTMDHLLLFMSDDEKASVLSDYTLIEQNSGDAANYVAKYPVLQSETIYVLKDISEEEYNTINPLMGKALIIVSTMEEALVDPQKAAAMAELEGFDLSKLPEGMDIFTILQSLPAQQLAQITAAVNEKFASLGDNIITQSASAAVQSEYAALGMDTAKVQSGYILRIGGLMLLVTLAAAACTIGVGFLSARIGSGAARDIRHSLFQKVESFSKAEFDSFSTASLITRSTNDITQVQMLIILSLRMIFYAPIMGVGAIIRASEKSPSMTWIIALGVVVLLSVVATVFTISLPRFQKIQKLIDRLNLVTRENLAGMMVIRSFNTQEFEQQRFDKANTDLTANMLFVNRIMVVMMPVMMLLMNGISILIIWVGAKQVSEMNIQVGDMMAFLQYAMQVVFSFLMLSLMFIMLPRAAVSGTRIAEVLDVEPSIQDPKDPKPFDEKKKGWVEFRNVSFRYPNAEENILCDINFVAKPGQTTAIIGGTGSGKSTVVNLIPRFFDVSEGSVLVDGVDVRDVSQHDLRDRIGYIPQKGMLFSGTIESNLRYADENSSEESLQRAADIAQATEFISGMEKGMQTEISQGGINVSGGQKQRLAIARALVKKPQIYIFDDALSALDFKTDSSLRKALKKETGSSTMIIVTQRISTVKNAEQIVVLNDGQVVGTGTHKELMETCETYREIATSQLTKEELS